MDVVCSMKPRTHDAEEELMSSTWGRTEASKSFNSSLGDSGDQGLVSKRMVLKVGSPQHQHHSTENLPESLIL